MTDRIRFAVPLAALLVAATGYMAAVAFRWLAIGAEPGEGAPGEGVVVVAGLLALVGGAAYCGLAASARARRASGWLLPVTAVGFVTAHFYSYDSYYAPGHRRFSEAGTVSATWIYGLVACALVLAALIKAQPRVGFGFGAILLIVCALTVLAEGAGH